MVKKYFVCANSSQGFFSFFPENLQGLDRIYILKGGPGTGKSTLMKKIGAHFFDLGYDVDYIYCSSDINALDGVMIPQLAVAVVNGTLPHVIEPTAVGAIDQYVNLGTALNLERLKIGKDKILRLQEAIANHYTDLYQAYATALSIHDEWEKVYIDEIDVKKADAFHKMMCQSLLDYPQTGRTPSIKRRFFGTTTADGTFDFIEDLTATLAKRYFIKGRPGSGKSTLLRVLAKKAEALGYDVEIYYCSFDPKSLDMILIPELSLCFFDSTSPHEYFPSKASDEIIDTYKAFIKPGVDEANRERLLDIEKRYKAAIAKGLAAFKAAKMAHDELEKIYLAATNFDVIDGFYEQIKGEIEEVSQVFRGEMPKSSRSRG